jgi:cysteine synthase A
MVRGEELAKKNGWSWRGGSNPANRVPQHDRAGISGFASKRLDYWVRDTARGTLTGAGEMLKKARPDIKVIVTEPEAPPSFQETSGSRTRSGWTPNFIPAVLSRDVYDEIVLVTDTEGATPRATSLEGRDLLRDLLRRDLAAARGWRRGAQGLRALAMLPDTGERVDDPLEGSTRNRRSARDGVEKFGPPAPAPLTTPSPRRESQGWRGLG